MPYNKYVEILVMGVNYFTDEQVEELRNNPYVKNVSHKAITYEESFKEVFFIDYQNGMSPSEIFYKYGFNPKVLGEKRLTNFVYQMKKQSNRPEGFEDTRKSNSGRTIERELSDKEIIERLKHKNKILQQENDFLKRIRFINKKQISKASKTKLQEKNTNL